MSDEESPVLSPKARAEELYKATKEVHDSLRTKQGTAWSDSRADRTINASILRADALQLLLGFDLIGEHPDAVAVRELTERMLRERLRRLVKEESKTEGATLAEDVVLRVMSLSDEMDAAIWWLSNEAKRAVLCELRDNIIARKLDDIAREELKLKRKPRPPGAETEKA